MTERFQKVSPHGDIEEAFERVHYLIGSVNLAPLMRITRTMTILEHEGALTLINAVRLSEKGEAALAALGRVAHVMKIGVHGMDDPYYIDRFGASYWALPGASLPGGLKADHEIRADGPLPIPEMKALIFEQTVAPEAVLLLPWSDGILISCDSIQNWVNTRGCSLPAKAATRLMGFIKPAQIGPPWRKRMTPEGGSLEPDFRQILAHDFKHLIGGHGPPLVGVARERLTETLARVYG